MYIMVSGEKEERDENIQRHQHVCYFNMQRTKKCDLKKGNLDIFQDMN